MAQKCGWSLGLQRKGFKLIRDIGKEKLIKWAKWAKQDYPPTCPPRCPLGELAELGGWHTRVSRPGEKIDEEILKVERTIVKFERKQLAVVKAYYVQKELSPRDSRLLKRIGVSRATFYRLLNQAEWRVGIVFS